ncbi:MAG: glycosyltransferase [Alphaproteobacteria bacterium]|nr:glycosyltransferase [Alphaproteobacteria bacterium]
MSGRQTRFSIITVCFNAERSIASTIASVAIQVYEDYEHLIIDGASRDNTCRIAEDNAHSRLRIHSEPDNGIYDAMNKGAARAGGDVLLFLNADDRLADDRVLSDVAALFAARPELQLVYGDVAHASGDGGLVELPQPRHLTRPVLAVTTICHQSLFARREVFEKIGPFREEFPVVSDWDWLYRAIMIERLPIGRLDRTIAVIGMEGVSHMVDFEPEKRKALRQYYTAAEVLRYRAAPLVLRRAKARLKRCWS